MTKTNYTQKKSQNSQNKNKKKQNYFIKFEDRQTNPLQSDRNS